MFRLKKKRPSGQATKNIFPDNVHRIAAEKLEAYEKHALKFKGKDRVCHLRNLYLLELENPRSSWGQLIWKGTGMISGHIAASWLVSSMWWWSWDVHIFSSSSKKWPCSRSVFFWLKSRIWGTSLTLLREFGVFASLRILGCHCHDNMVTVSMIICPTFLMEKNGETSNYSIGEYTDTLSHYWCAHVSKSKNQTYPSVIYFLQNTICPPCHWK